MFDLQKEIVRLIPSKDLKSKILELGFIMDDHTLLVTVLDCTPDFESRIKYLKLLLDHCSNEKVKAKIQTIIGIQEKAPEEFESSDCDTVYELHIKETPDSYDERYLCKTYQNALDMIDRFFDGYECEKTSLCRYSIVKRRILSNSFDEDKLGEAVFLYNKALYSIENHNRLTDCDGNCRGCDLYCLNPDDAAYPVFTSDGELIKYKTADGNEQYGIVYWFSNNTQAEYACIIPLDTPYMHYRDFENAGNSHTHIKQTFIEKADINDIEPKFKTIYLDYLKFYNNQKNHR